MLDFTQFKDEFISGCRNALNTDMNFGGEIGNDIEIEEGCICKPQYGELTGLCFKRSGACGGPTVYVEDFYPLYCKGASIDRLSADAVNAIRPYLDNLPDFPDDVFDPGKCPENLRIRLLSKKCNKAALEQMPYMDLGCGLVLTADIHMGDFRAPVTSAMIKETDLSPDELIGLALENSSADDAVLMRLDEILDKECEVPANYLESPDGTALNGADRLYILTNRDSYWGAAVLFYPGVMMKVHELLGGDFYVLPSSVHELLVLQAAGHDPQELADTIKQANRTVVGKDEILADDLFICDSVRLMRVSYGGIVPSPGQMMS